MDDFELGSPEALAAAMGELKASIVDLRRALAPAAPKPAPEARAAIREKARTGALKPLRKPPAAPATGMVGPRATGRVTPEMAMQAQIPQARPETGPTAELEAVEGWESLSDMAAQNQAKPRPRRK